MKTSERLETDRSYNDLRETGCTMGAMKTSETEPEALATHPAEKSPRSPNRLWKLLAAAAFSGGLFAQVDVATTQLKIARDTGDIAQYKQAEAALQLSPAGYDTQKLQVTILIGKHEYANALKLATELNRKVPDDIQGWSLLVDANSALGNYAEAERAAQWILDLRPGSALGFEKAAGLREHFGDPEGAIEFYQEANRRTSQNDTVQRAWLLTQVARLELASGNLKQAETVLNQALALFPKSHQAAAVLASLKAKEAAK